MDVETCSRKPHRKSRNGCKTCKSRKVKCDEKTPACSNCVKRAIQCDYLLQPKSCSSPSTYHSPYATTPQYSTPYAGQSPYAPPLLNPALLPRELPKLQSPDGQLPSLNMIDLELLHNFCNTTCNTLHNDSSMKSLWRVNVPQLAFSSDFVMRGVLALSALHLSFHRPQKRELYLSYAMAHHNAGLIGATQALRNVSDDNCSALYIFTAMCCMFNLAPPRQPGDFLVIGNSGIAEWLTLFRGTRSLLNTNSETLKKGPLGPMFLLGARRYVPRAKFVADGFTEGDRLAELLNLIHAQGTDPDTLEIYEEAISELRSCYVSIYQSGAQQPPYSLEISDVFRWLFAITDKYLALLKDLKQEALSIFAFFCVVPRKLEMNWWLEGLSSHLMSRMYELLDEEHRLWIRWPIDEIGWVPS